MDKSFNDQELSDIMKEIEALEDNFQSEVVKMEATEEEIMEELAALDAEGPAPKKVVPVLAQMKEAKVVPMSQSKNKPAPTSMSFKVSGEMNLELQFDIDGKVVCIEVNEEGLHLQMDGGMTFTVPVKKAA